MIPINLTRYNLKIFYLPNGKAPYMEWLESLDRSSKARVGLRIARFEDGSFGDYKSVGGNILEARFFFGAGYRVYFSIQDTKIILLLTGGDKSTQAADIKKAKELLEIYLEEQNAIKNK